MEPHERAERLNLVALFQERELFDDGYGNETGEWQDRFSAWCGVQYLRGGEAVMASRLEARQPVIITVRISANARLVGPEWRCIIQGETYNIRERPRPSRDRGALEFLAESGVAT